MSIDTRTRAPRNQWLVGGLIVTVLALLAAGVAVWLWLAGAGATHTESQSQTYRHPVTRVELDLASGGVNVTAGPDDQVVVDRRLQWKSSNKPTFTEEWSGNTLRITARCPDERGNCSAEYSLRVPAGTAVRADTGAGELKVRDLTGELRLQTGAGDVGINNATGTLWVRTEAGEVTGSGLRSPTTDIEAGDGGLDLRYAGVPQSVRATTRSGDVRIALPDAGDNSGSGYLVRADTGDGQRSVSVREDSAGQHTIAVSTGDGDVTVAYA